MENETTGKPKQEFSIDAALAILEHAAVLDQKEKTYEESAKKNFCHLWREVYGNSTDKTGATLYDPIATKLLGELLKENRFEKIIREYVIPND